MLHSTNGSSIVLHIALKSLLSSVTWLLCLPLCVSAAPAQTLPSTLEADQLQGRPNVETTASGHVDFRQGGKRIEADHLTYQHVSDTAHAKGQVKFSNLAGNWFKGPELTLGVSSLEGVFLEPTYFIARTQAGGHAQRWEFLGENHARAIRATYTSCPVEENGTSPPAWELSAHKLDLDFERNVGQAHSGVLRFYGVPIFAWPVLSFSLSNERKSGWLPLSAHTSNTNGLELVAPYYWNLAPNRDATIAPIFSARRGLGLEGRFRYLEPSFQGQILTHAVPKDSQIKTKRASLNVEHQGSAWHEAVQYDARVFRVSDDSYWKDYSRYITGQITPRLLNAQAGARYDFGSWLGYVNVKRWQVLQDVDLAAQIRAPYDRWPQLGLRTTDAVRLGGLELSLAGEFNQFVNPDGHLPGLTSVQTAEGTFERPTGSRTHAVGALSWPIRSPGWLLTPKLSLNSAHYQLNQPLAVGPYAGASQLSRSIPTASLDSAWVFERDTRWWGRSVRQTLEPRLLYVHTPYRAQAGLPLFDTAQRDFNVESIYADNNFSGVDRVSDARQLTAGITSRFLDPDNAKERVRMGLAQRFLFKPQRVTANDGPALTQGASDLLAFGTSNLWQRWYLESALQYNYDLARIVRSSVGARYAPGPYRTIGVNYGFKRGGSVEPGTEQANLSWQWPLYQRQASANSPSCQGGWYSAGKINYSIKESRMTESIVALEYDSGCWVGRLMAKRKSTSASQASTEFGIELEFVGLARLPVNNPLKVLRENVAGYLPLRQAR
jgi:LPS-assembly protein